VAYFGPFHFMVFTFIDILLDIVRTLYFLNITVKFITN